MTVPTIEIEPEIVPDAIPEAPAGPDGDLGADTPPELAADGSGTDDGASPMDDEDRKRRRRYILLAILGFLALGLLLFTLWYLLFRKPISELVPPLNLATPPAYQYSLYGLTKPLGVATSADGSRLYITQTSGTQETVVFDSRGTKLGVLAPPESVTTHANQLYVAVNPKTGDVYASDRTAGQVYEYTADGTYKGTFDNGPSIDVWQPLGIAFDSKGDLFVGDAGGAFQTVHEFGPDGTPVRDFTPADPLSFPNGVAVDKTGNVYVSDSNNGRVVVFDSDGKQLGAIRRGATAGELGMPRGIVIDGQDRLLVVDSVGQGVLMFKSIQPGEPGPAYLIRFGREGTVDGSFEFPNAISLDTRGHVYITDWNNDRVQVWAY